MKRWAGCLTLCWVLAVAAPVRAGGPPPESRTFHGKTAGEWADGLADGDPRARRRAAAALGLGGFGKAAVPPLLRALRDPDEGVRGSAALALGNLGADAA